MDKNTIRFMLCGFGIAFVVPLPGTIASLASPFAPRKGRLGGLTGVEGGCLVCGGLGFLGVGAGVDGGFCPCVAAAGDEGDAFGGEGEFFGFRLFEVGIGYV